MNEKQHSYLHLQMVCWTIGDDHPVAKHILILADSNMTIARKQAVVERQRSLDSLKAEQLLEQERLSAREMPDERALERQELTPVPERLWALRNIAATMALGDRRSREKARELYTKALDLQRSDMAEDKHPGLLGEVWRCVRITCYELHIHNLGSLSLCFRWRGYTTLSTRRMLPYAVVHSVQSNVLCCSSTNYYQQVQNKTKHMFTKMKIHSYHSLKQDGP